MTYKAHIARYHDSAARFGLTYLQADSIRRDSQRLHTWCEHECNGVIERDEETGKTYGVYNIDGPGPIKRYRTPDRETGALARIRTVAESVGAAVEYQGDPRGWPITLKWADGRELCPPCR